jgi:hypothetical protein
MTLEVAYPLVCWRVSWPEGPDHIPRVMSLIDATRLGHGTDVMRPAGGNVRYNGTREPSLPPVRTTGAAVMIRGTGVGD